MNLSQAPNAFFNLEAEACLLGAALQEQDCVKYVVELKEDALYDARHKAIRQCICALSKSNTVVDLVTVDDWISRNKLMDVIGGEEYLLDLIQYVPSTVGAKHWQRIINECAMRRTLYTIAKELMRRADTIDEPETIREWAARTIKDVKLGEAVRLIDMQEACFATYSKLEKDQMLDDGVEKRILSGIETLDAKLGGLHGGEYVAIGARPSVGKSILALTFCVNAAKAGKRALLVSLEMSETQITERILANDSGVPLNQITSGRITLEGWEGVAKAIAPASKLPLWYCLDATTVELVRKAAYQLYENGGLDMIAIDYLQLMEATYAKRQSRQEQISEISRGLRLLAQELQIPILVLTQLNRASVNERYEGKKVKREPTMSEARESGAIEQDANVFILLHNPDRDEMQSEFEISTWENLHDKGMTMMRIIIDKNRQGKRGRLTVAFDGDRMRFLPIRKEKQEDEK